MAQKKIIMDGCTAATYVAYAMSEVATIYPITPIAEMGEVADKWAVEGRKNVFGQTMQVRELESELGAAGATHGAAAGGALATTFTSSQGLMLMVPNMFKIAGNLWPVVFHVGSRAVATHALSIFCDHSDVMACRSTGFTMMCSASVQETHDLAIVAHLAAIRSSVPVLHWFDGFRTSNEMQTIQTLDYSDIATLMPWDDVAAFRRRAMNPEHSDIRGTAQNPDIYFQNREACNTHYDAVAQIVQEQMDAVAKLTGRQYHLFDYVGDPQAEAVTVSMGSSCDVMDETVRYLNQHGYKVGHIKVRLYRPFVAEAFLKALPDTVKYIAVLDRYKEPGAQCEALCADVRTALYDAGRMVKVIGGRYGIGSKNFSPGMGKAVFDELLKPDGKKKFTVGINDDVTHLSLDYDDQLDPLPDGASQAIFYGIGADGTVGATKQAAAIIGNAENLYAQAYFNYSAKKSGGYTISQLRFSKSPIKAAYEIIDADYVGCHKDVYVHKYDMIDSLRPGGTFVINSHWNTLQDLDAQLPAAMKRKIAAKGIKLYNVDALSIAQKHGLGERINMIMETAFFHLMNIMPQDQAVAALKAQIAETYIHEGQNIVDANCAAVDDAIQAITPIQYPASWTQAEPGQLELKRQARVALMPQWERTVGMPMLMLRGNEVPVSKMTPDGTFPAGTTAYEKRRIAAKIPIWNADKCIECTECTFVCSHASIRPFVATAEEMKGAPATFVTKDAWNKELVGMKWRIQVYPDDCTGCASCATVCPARALTMEPIEQHDAVEEANLDFAQKHISSKAGLLPRFTIPGSQLYTPLMEFSGACGGCGETPYVKLLTQLFGEYSVIANATGCSSIWGADTPSTAYCRNENGMGPAWGNSLFEDNAEYAYGIATGITHRREALASIAQAMAADPKAAETPLGQAMAAWAKVQQDYQKSYKAGLDVKKALADDPDNAYAKQIAPNADVLGRKIVWAVGGDGWAYDIGFAGLDHVLASGIDINILVLDTQCYSNTGGQTSKATPYGACAKYSYAGKREYHKNLGQMMMTYRNIYVASVAIGGNMQQTVQAFKEAAEYQGPSIIIAYCPCINFGIKAGMGTTIINELQAVQSRFWPLYRFNPSEKENPLFDDSACYAQSPELPGPPKWTPKPWVHENIISFGQSTPRNGADNPLVLDYLQSIEPTQMTPMLLGQNRFAVLGSRLSPQVAQDLYDRLQTASQANVQRLADQRD